MKKIKIGDIVVVSLILLITAGVFCFRLFGFDVGKACSVSVDGVTTVYSMERDHEVSIESNGITLCLVIKNGEVFIKDSSCPEQTCVKRGGINRIGETVVCVPSKVYIKIVGEGELDYDYILG